MQAMPIPSSAKAKKAMICHYTSHDAINFDTRALEDLQGPSQPLDYINFWMQLYLYCRYIVQNVLITLFEAI